MEKLTTAGVAYFIEASFREKVAGWPLGPDAQAQASTGYLHRVQAGCPLTLPDLIPLSRAASGVSRHRRGTSGGNYVRLGDSRLAATLRSLRQAARRHPLHAGGGHVPPSFGAGAL